MRLTMDPVSIKPEPGTLAFSSTDNSSSSKVVVVADLNFKPPDTDDNDPAQFSASVVLTRLPSEDTLMSKDMDTIEVEGKKLNRGARSRSRSKIESPLEYGADADGDPCGQGVSLSREEKFSSLKTGLVHVARKMTKNAHAHFILGLMYQRLGQAQKAIPAYEKATEILLGYEADIARPDLLSVVQIHHAQCLLLEGIGDTSSDKELETEELEEILSKLKKSTESDIRQAAVWNTLGFILLRSGRLQSALSVLSALLDLVPDNYDCLANLGIAYLQSGDFEQSAKCFKELVLKDQNHPTALINYAAFLLCRYCSVVAGAGANAGDGASTDQIVAVNAAKECLLAALSSDPKAAHTWVNLANAYYMTGDHKSSSKCLEKAAKLEPNCMSTRYAVALHRLKDVERSQNASEQLAWAGNEMASIIREGDSVPIDTLVAWSGLAMVHKAQHEIAAAFETEQNDLLETEERAVYSLKQAIAEDPDDAVQWHQLGLHCLYSQQYKMAQNYLKAAVARFKDCSYAWSNLGISLQLSNEQQPAKDVYERALTLASTDQAHAIFSNLGNLYRQTKQYDRAKAMFSKSLELQPGYAPAYNNLGLVFVAEGKWEEAKFFFDKALLADPFLDAAKSNAVKVVTMSRLCTGVSSCIIQD